MNASPSHGRARRFSLRSAITAAGAVALLAGGGSSASAGTLDDLLGGSSGDNVVGDSAACSTSVNTGTASLTNLVTTLQGILCGLGTVQYTVHTEYVPHNGGTPVVKNYPAVVGVPTLVNASSPTGLTTELVVTVSPLASKVPGVRVLVKKQSGVPLDFPVKVEAVFKAPATAKLPRNQLAFGYDATDESASPKAFSTDFGLALKPGTVTTPQFRSRFAAVMGDEASGTLLGGGRTASKYPLNMVATVFNGTPNDRVKPIEGTVRFAPVYASDSKFDLTFGQTALTARYAMPKSAKALNPPPQNPVVLSAGLTGENPSPDLASIALHAEIGDVTQPASVTNRMPEDVSVTYDQLSSTKTKISYAASSEINVLKSNARIDQVGGEVMKANLTAEGVPATMDFTYDRPEEGTADITYTASDTLDVIDAGFVTGLLDVSTDIFIPKLDAHLRVEDIPAYMRAHVGSTTPDCSGLNEWDPETESCTPGGSVTVPSQQEVLFTTTPEGGTSAGGIGLIDARVKLGDQTYPADFTLPNDIQPGGEGATLLMLHGRLDARVVVRGLSDVRFLSPVAKDNAESTPEAPAKVSLKHDSGRFDVGMHVLDNGVGERTEIPETEFSATIKDVPELLNFEFWPTSSKIHYDDGANGPEIDSITAKVKLVGTPDMTADLTINGVPNRIDVDLNEDALVWDASDTVDNIDLVLDGLPVDDIGITWAHAYIKELPENFTIGIDPEFGVGLLQGASGPIGEIGLHAGTGAEAPQGIQTPENQNTVYVAGHNQNPSKKRVDVRLFNLQEAWAKAPSGAPAEAHLKFNACPGGANAAVPAPCPIKVALPKWNGSAPYPNADSVSAYIGAGQPGAPDTAWYTGIQADVPIPPAGIDLKLNEVVQPASAAGRKDGGEALKAAYDTYNLCTQGSNGDIADGVADGFCKGPIPSPEGKPILVRIASASGFGNNHVTLSATTIEVSDLPQHVALCLGAGRACGAGTINSTYHELCTPGDCPDDEPFYMPLDTALTVTSNATVPLLINQVRTCSGQALRSIWLSTGGCDQWGSLTSFDRVTIDNVKVPTNQIKFGLGSEMYAFDNNELLSEAVGMLVDTDNEELSMGHLNYGEAGEEDAFVIINKAGLKAQDKTWFFRALTNWGQGGTLAVRADMSIFVDVVGGISFSGDDLLLPYSPVDSTY